jgi:hypothetical protein
MLALLMRGFMMNQIEIVSSGVINKYTPCFVKNDTDFLATLWFCLTDPNDCNAGKTDGK